VLERAAFGDAEETAKDSVKVKATQVQTSALMNLRTGRLLGMTSLSTTRNAHASVLAPFVIT